MRVGIADRYDMRQRIRHRPRRRLGARHGQGHEHAQPHGAEVRAEGDAGPRMGIP